MKQITSRLLIAGIALLTVPSVLFAQKEKEEKEKKDFQQIIITRSNNADEKMIIEVDGDKVKVNGKDVKDNKDVHVNVSTMKGNGLYRFNGSNMKSFNMDFNNDFSTSLFSEDANRAMLGVVTEGNEKGAVVQSITKESAADKMGLKKGDVITMIGEKKIESTDDVTDAIHNHKPGEKISITYLRDGKEQKATAELGKWKGMKMNAVAIPRIAELNGKLNMIAPEPMFNQTWNFGRPRLGLSIQDTDDGIGVKVLDVDEESNAAKAGIKKDDVILGVDDHEVKGTDDVTRLMRDNKEKSTYNFKIRRDGKTQNIELKIPRKLKTADL